MDKDSSLSQNDEAPTAVVNKLIPNIDNRDPNSNSTYLGKDDPSIQTFDQINDINIQGKEKLDKYADSIKMIKLLL